MTEEDMRKEAARRLTALGVNQNMIDYIKNKKTIVALPTGTIVELENQEVALDHHEAALKKLKSLNKNILPFYQISTSDPGLKLEYIVTLFISPDREQLQQEFYFNDGYKHTAYVYFPQQFDSEEKGYITDVPLVTIQNQLFINHATTKDRSHWRIFENQIVTDRLV